MLFKTHLAFSFLISLFLCPYFITPPLISIIIICFSSLLPDIDHPRSIITKKNPLNFLTKYIFKHRGILHSLFMPILLYLIFSLINKEMATLMFVGYTSHLFIDSFTKRGIKPLYPISTLKINGNTRTGSFVERFLLFLLIMIILIKLLLPHWTYARNIFK